MNKEIKSWLEISELAPWHINVLVILVGIIMGLLMKWFFIKFLRLSMKLGKDFLIESAIKHLSNVLNYLFPSLLITISLSLLPNSYEIRPVIRIFNIFLIINFAWLAAQSLNIFQDFVYRQFESEDIAQSFKERKVRTQVKFIRKLGTVVIILISLALIMMSFRTLRELGTGLLASAGLAGIIIGFAAQKTLSNLLAGLQIAFTQPIKIGDSLIVEGDWGNVEDITLTYVVVNTWDWRRIILPITYFVEKPFQNWTRQQAELIGSVFLYVDYRLPVEELRHELTRIIEKEPLWDKQVQVLQVVDTTERCMVLRALVSAATAPQAWDLRCSVREKLINFISANYPAYFPTTRVWLEHEAEKPWETTEGPLGNHQRHNASGRT